MAYRKDSWLNFYSKQDDKSIEFLFFYYKTGEVIVEKNTRKLQSIRN